MGRSKMQLKFIEERGKRSATYRKRIGGLKKKAGELAILCDVPVLVISFGPQGEVETWPEDNQAAGCIIRRYRELSTDIRNKRKLDLRGYLKAEINRRRASFNRRIRDLADMPSLPWHDSLHAMHDSLRELACRLDSRMEAIQERIKLLQDGQQFNEGETSNLGGRCLEIAPRNGMMGVRHTCSCHDLMVPHPYLTMNTSLQHPPQPMSFISRDQISAGAFLQHPYAPMGMNGAPFAMVPSIPMNMDGVHFAMVPSIPTSSMSPWIGPMSGYDSANGDAVPVHPPKSSIGLFENNNLMEASAAEQNHTNAVVNHTNVHHLADSFEADQLVGGAGPEQTSVSNEAWPFAWKP